ncbi:unnamed protein product [Cylicocyclus nassatus]|uniref:Sin1 middle CRIM domain-containing protein n=1 Tax=Cylicocyclus nassatus TaxID=53992 RepID=A0AA36HA81_CYLNA|nr:unnamed protein product [Cylicocyclus nassatus]
MAFSDEQELIDQIRHDLRMEDDSGVCIKVVIPERRRARYGGLPLNFRSATSSDDEEEPCNSGYFGYEIPEKGDPVHTKEIIENRLRSRTVGSADIGGFQLVQKSGDSGELFVTKKLKAVRSPVRSRSLISKYITENGPALNNPLLEYARFEAVGDQQSKTVLVLYPDESRSHGNIPSIQISVQPLARVGQVIGYCLYRYLTDFGDVLSDNVDNFQLMMADESGEIELDLPPLDKGRAIGELGFPVLALVSKKRIRNGELELKHKVIVYTPDSQQYIFELENLDHTLLWLRDETVKRKRADIDERELELMPEIDYDLEDINVFGKPLNLRQSIANSGCTEFVLVRKFSSRGDFHPRGIHRQKSALLTPVSRSSDKNSVFDFDISRVNSLDTTCSGATSPVLFADDDDTIMTFPVTRLHRMRRNWPATMSIRCDSFDVVPFVHRKSFLPHSHHKTITVPWDYLCEVKLAARDPANTSILSITFLPSISKVANPPEEEITLRQIVQYYNDRDWKTIHLEFESHEQAAQARSHMDDAIRTLNAPAYQAYQRSFNGSRGPAASAESLLMEMADELLPSSSSSRSIKTSAIRKLRKLRKTFDMRD